MAHNGVCCYGSVLVEYMNLMAVMHIRIILASY